MRQQSIFGAAASTVRKVATENTTEYKQVALSTMSDGRATTPRV